MAHIRRRIAPRPETWEDVTYCGWCGDPANFWLGDRWACDECWIENFEEVNDG